MAPPSTMDRMRSLPLLVFRQFCLAEPSGGVTRAQKASQPFLRVQNMLIAPTA